MRRWAIASLTAVVSLAFSCTSAFAAAPLADPTTPLVPGGPSLQFIGSETGSWESNPLLLFHDVKPLYGSITTPELIFNGKTPTSLLSIDALVNENIYNQEDFSSTDFHGKVNFAEQMQNWGLSIQQATDYDTTRTSELFPVGTNNTISNVPVRHLGLSLGPQVSYSPTSIDKVSLSTSIQDSQYDNPIFSNYVITSVKPEYQHSFDPINAGTFSVQAQRYQSTSGPQSYTDTVGPQIGWIGNLTPRFTIKASAGVQASRQFGSGTVQVPWTLQYVYAADIAFKGQQDTTHFTAARADYPFGNGTETLLSSYTLTEDHALNERFSLNATASYQYATYDSNAPGSLDDLMTGGGGMTYHATERLDVKAAYQYRRETLLSTAGEAQDHMVTLGLVYRPNAWSF